MEDDLNPIKQELKIMREQMDIHASKMDDMENRLRRNNVRVLGLPERSKGSNPIAFLEKWIREIFGKNTFSTTFFFLMKEHRVTF